MKKFKTLMASMFVMALICFSLTPQLSNAQGNPPPDEDDWVCCQSISDGCRTITGMWFPTDYKYYGDVCP